MAWLRDAANVVTISDALANRTRRGLNVAVTFDDGYTSVFANAFPIQQRLGIPGTVFLNTALVGDRARTSSDESKGHYPGETFLLWPEVSAMSAQGWTIGSHGSEHLDLTVEPDQTVRGQLQASKRHIERTLATPCDFFAYTWGRSNGHVRAMTAEAGYRNAFAGFHAPLRADCDPMGIPRINISRDYSLSDFKSIVRGNWDFLGWSQKARDHRS
jgi:peptidoglycan/xylan/chitin deacetylase (PgdA/CDA1 family)